MRPEDLTIEALERKIGAPPEKWEGQCFALACAAAELIGPKALAVYGHYLGPVHPEGFWGQHHGAAFVQHGWVLLSDGRILDPTRWSFEKLRPYIFISAEANDSDYDEGGNRWRSAMQKPPPSFQADDRMVDFESITSEDDALFQRIAMLIGRPEVVLCRHLVLNMAQVFWLANVPYEKLQPFAAPIYSAIMEALPLAGEGFIPFDNRERAKRERSQA